MTSGSLTRARPIRREFQGKRENSVDRFSWNFRIESLVRRTCEIRSGTWLSKGRRIAPSRVRIPAWSISIDSVRCQTFGMRYLHCDSNRALAVVDQNRGLPSNRLKSRFCAVSFILDVKSFAHAQLWDWQLAVRPMKRNANWNHNERKIHFRTEKSAIMFHEFASYCLNNWKDSTVGKCGLIGRSKNRAVTQTMRWGIFIFQTIVGISWFQSISLISRSISNSFQGDLVPPLSNPQVSHLFRHFMRVPTASDCDILLN
jgi:hypothetical protein